MPSDLPSSEKPIITIILCLLSLIFDELAQHMWSFLSFLIVLFIQYPNIKARVRNIYNAYFNKNKNATK